MPPTRFPDWPERLTRYLDSCSSRTFAYGSHDCCLFVADAVLAMTGTDIATEFRGKYRSHKEALRLAKPSMRHFLEKQLSVLPSVNPSHAQRGDIVMLGRDSDYSLGIIALNGRDVLKPGDIGLMPQFLSTAVKAWHV